MMPLWVMRDSFFEYIESSMGAEYADKVLALTPTWALFAFIAAAFLAGIAGAYLGKAVLKKHFDKAGIY
jgi:energy-coupling factor transport system substrate-specific component